MAKEAEEERGRRERGGRGDSSEHFYRNIFSDRDCFVSVGKSTLSKSFTAEINFGQRVRMSRGGYVFPVL